MTLQDRQGTSSMAMLVSEREVSLEELGKLKNLVSRVLTVEVKRNQLGSMKKRKEVSHNVQVVEKVFILACLSNL
jgi:hypothetical protein